MEKRSSIRRQIVYNLKIYDNKTNRLLGFLEDISSEGLMMVKMEPMEIGAVMELNMDLLERIHPDKHMSFNAKVLWCKKDVNHEFYEIGCKFQDLKVTQILVIEQLIKDSFMSG
jgi:hypothetical protein